MKQQVLKVHKDDNVLVALTNLPKGAQIVFENETYVLQDEIKAKHKFFTKDMQPGDKVIMYGVLVGTAQSFIPKGGWMSTSNVKHAADPYDWRKVDYQWTPPDISRFEGRTFNGYHRSNGDVGTANYWLFIPTVFCENRNLDVIREALHNELGYAVTDKYKRYTHKLADAFKKGENIEAIDIFEPPAPSAVMRPFKNVDGIKFLNHQGG